MTFFASKEIQNIINVPDNENMHECVLKNNLGNEIIFDFSEIDIKKKKLTGFCCDNNVIENTLLGNLNYTLCLKKINIYLLLEKIKILKQNKTKLIFSIT